VRKIGRVGRSHEANEDGEAGLYEDDSFKTRKEERLYFQAGATRKTMHQILERLHD
jgi:hypothetical protein